MKASESRISAIILLVVVAIICVFAANIFLGMYKSDEIITGKGVTEIRMLSDWFPTLKGTPGDTQVYILKGEKAGAEALVLGGTHSNEPSGYLTAVLLIENAIVNEGALYIIPRANDSAFTCNNPGDAQPRAISFVNDEGVTRQFTCGSRGTNPIHQYPDPDVYKNYAGQSLSGSETRNLNRCYPGKPDGTLTEQICYGIVQLINSESIDVSIDLHEASPEYAVVNALVTHERAMFLSATVVMDLQFDGINISLEPSPVNLRGLSHRELGDYTDTLAILMETTNPSQGRLRGGTNEQLVMKGLDEYYLAAAKLGLLKVPYDENGWPIEVRVARHIAGLSKIFSTYSQLYENNLVISDIPGYQELCDEGIGTFLN